MGIVDITKVGGKSAATQRSLECKAMDLGNCQFRNSGISGSLLV